MASKSTRGKNKKQISPTNVRKFRAECERRWAFAAIFGQPEPTTDALDIGTGLHWEGENYYKNGVIPTTKVIHGVDVGKMFARAIALHLVPLPGPGVFSEVPVKLPKVDGFEMVGTADLVQQTQGLIVLYDYKTCAAKFWAKTEKQLREDEQVNIYGLAVMNKFKVDWIRCHWVYFPKDGTKPFTVEFSLTRKKAELYWAKCIPSIQAMLAAYKNKPRITSPEEFEGNLDNCGAFNKDCHYLKQCEKWKRTSKQKEEDMGDFDKLLEDLEASKTKAPAAEAPVEQSPPKSQPQDLSDLHDSLVGGGEINAPEGPTESLPEPEVVEAAPKEEPKKKKRGRPRKVKAEVVAPTPPAPEGLTPIRVYVGCLPVRGPDRTAYKSLVELASEAMESACQEHGVDHWRLIDFKSEGALAAHFQQWLIDHDFTGAVVMDSFGSATRALLEAFELMSEDRVSIVKALKG